MNTRPIQCPKCQAMLLGPIPNRPGLEPCPACGAELRVDVYPAFFRQPSQGQKGETILVEGEAGCFYHPKKKAVCPCDLCGRFLCALCECDVDGQRICPACLESGRQKQNIEGLVSERMLHQLPALLCSVVPLYLTGILAVYLALRYWKAPGSLIAPRKWAMPAALVFGGIQTVAFTSWIIWKSTH